MVILCAEDWLVWEKCRGMGGGGRGNESVKEVAVNSEGEDVLKIQSDSNAKERHANSPI